MMRASGSIGKSEVAQITTGEMEEDITLTETFAIY